MVDTRRPLGALLALLPDNAAGEISPQDARDWLVSLPLLPEWAPNYNFAAILGSSVSSGTLVAATVATLTFTSANPCPWGVNGSDVGKSHYLYISGGSGVAEAVLITGGTAVAGGSSGTLTFVPANNHSGAWTLSSASGGIKEADIQNGSGKSIRGDGIFHLYAPIVFSAATAFVGMAQNSTVLSVDFAAGDALTISGGAVRIECAHFTIAASVARDPGTLMISCKATAALANDTKPDLHDIDFFSSWAAVGFNNCAVGFATNLYFYEYTFGMIIGGPLGPSGITASAIKGQTGQVNATHVLCTSGLLNLVNFEFQDSSPGGTGVGILFNPAAGQQFGECSFAGGTLDGGWGPSMSFAGTAGGTIFHIVFTSIVFTAGNNPSRTAINITDCVEALQFIGMSIGCGSAALQPIVMNGGSHITFDELRIMAMSSAGGVGIVLGAALFTPTKHFTLVNSHIGYSVLGTVIGNMAYAINLGLVDHPDMNISGNTLYGATLPIGFPPVAAMTRAVIADNVGLTTFRHTLASAAALTFPVLDQGAVVELTGNTTVTSVAGLREGQTGFLVATAAAPGGITQGNNIQAPTIANFTRYQLYRWAFTNSLFYLS